MSLISSIIIYISQFTRGATKRRRMKQELKEIEKSAYARHKDIKQDIKWQEAKKKAEERGMERAITTPMDRINAKVKARREKVKEQRAKSTISIKKDDVAVKQTNNIGAFLGVDKIASSKPSALISSSYSKKLEVSNITNKTKGIDLSKKE
jgi:hypothetical protein